MSQEKKSALEVRLRVIEAEVREAKVNYQRGHATYLHAVELLQNGLRKLDSAVKTAEYERSLVRNELLDLEVVEKQEFSSDGFQYDEWCIKCNDLYASFNGRVDCPQCNQQKEL